LVVVNAEYVPHANHIVGIDNSGYRVYDSGLGNYMYGVFVAYRVMV
jgi:hypothetical protein